MTDPYAPAVVCLSIPEALREVAIARHRRNELLDSYERAHGDFVAAMRAARVAGARTPAIAASAGLSAQRVRRHIAGVSPAA